MRRNLLTLFCFMVAVMGLHAQVTTSSFRGSVSDASGGPLPGATVVAFHKPSGTSYGVITRLDGSYSIPNVRIGGPYKVEVSFTGFKTFESEDIYLKLGEKRRLNVTLNEGVDLGEVVVIGDRTAIINPDRTGAATSLWNNCRPCRPLPVPQLTLLE